MLGDDFVKIDFSDGLPEIHANFLSHPEHGYEPGLQIGELGILAPAVCAGNREPKLVRQLERAMGACVHHPAREMTSGAAGMMHAAMTLFDSTTDERWLRHYIEGAHALMESQIVGGKHNGLWRSEIFGGSQHYYGACHGIAGNVAALARGRAYLNESKIEHVLATAVGTLEAGSISNGPDINWPISNDPGGDRLLVQWCHGAAGIVTSLASTPRIGGDTDGKLNGLLTRAGEFVWKVGPLAKGPNICHGTPGNGYAFLALFKRFGDRQWLDRAKNFAMHSIGQRTKERKMYGCGRFTLWTGDGGLAVYLRDCLEAEVSDQLKFPGLEAM